MSKTKKMIVVSTATMLMLSSFVLAEEPKKDEVETSRGNQSISAPGNRPMPLPLPIKVERPGIGNEKKEEKRVEQQGNEKALEKRAQLAERKAALEAQKLLKQAEKQALRARAVEERLFIQGKTMKFDVPPVIREGRTLVPVRAISEGLGAQVEWDQELKKVTITKDDKVIELILGSNIVTVNGETYELDVPAQLMNNRTIVPIRFISEILGVSVDYDEETGDIDIGLRDPDPLDSVDEDASNTEEGKTEEGNTEEGNTEEGNTEEENAEEVTTEVLQQ